MESQIEIEKKELLSLQSIDNSNLLSVSPSTSLGGPVSIPSSNGQTIDSNGHPPASGLIANGHNGQGEKESKETKETEFPIGFPIGNSVSKSNGQPIILKERKRKILSLMKEDKWTSIREISVSLPELGAKSIQRDLLEMADAGILKKIGDKRWRKYSLV